MSKIVVLLPAYNEELAIGPVLDRIGKALKDRDYQILLVDDGSTDKTLETARQWSSKVPLMIISRPVNGGLGAALSDGIKFVVGRNEGTDVLITMDADNTFDPALIPKMTEIISGGFDIVIASRYVWGAKVTGVPVMRRFLSVAIGWILRRVFPTEHVSDYTSGYRAYRVAVIQRLSKRFQPVLRSTGFAAMMELLAKGIAVGARCQEVPVNLRYDLKPGASKLRLSKTVVEYLRAIGSTWREIKRAV